MGRHIYVWFHPYCSVILDLYKHIWVNRGFKYSLRSHKLTQETQVQLCPIQDVENIKSEF